MGCCRDGNSNDHSHDHAPVRPSIRGSGGGGGNVGGSLRRAPLSGDVEDRRARPVGGCCGGRDLGPLSCDEGPSEADVERFSSPTRTCPECKTEVYDDTAVCWSCGHAFGSSRESAPLPGWVLVGAGIALAAFVGVLVL